MIVKINKIKNLGLVFAQYVWDADLPTFKQLNLIDQVTADWTRFAHPHSSSEM